MRRRFFLASTSLAAMSCAMMASAQSSTETYTYDSLGRLVKVVTTGGQNNSETQAICYDKADNRTQYVANNSAGATGCITAPTPTPTPTPAPTPTPTPTPTPGNNPPVTQNDSVSGQCYLVVTVNLTANDSDPEGNTPLVLQSIVTGGGGVAGANIVSASSVSVDFGPQGDVTQATYTVADSLGAASTGVLTISTTSCGGGGL